MGSVVRLPCGRFRLLVVGKIMWAPILSAVVGLVDKLIPDPQAAAAAKLKLFELEKQGQLAELQGAVSIIVAEASGNALQRSWRPLLMLTFGGLIVARWFGWSAPNLSEAEYTHLWNIVELGIGGYVIGRSVEKTVPAITEALRK